MNKFIKNMCYAIAIACGCAVLVGGDYSAYASQNVDKKKYSKSSLNRDQLLEIARRGGHADGDDVGNIIAVVLRNNKIRLPLILCSGVFAPQMEHVPNAIHEAGYKYPIANAIDWIAILGKENSETEEKNTSRIFKWLQGGEFFFRDFQEKMRLYMENADVSGSPDWGVLKQYYRGLLEYLRIVGEIAGNRDCVE